MIDFAAYAQMYAIKVQEFRKAHPDFDELVKNSTCYIGQEVQLAIIGLDNAAEVTYFLALNPELAERLGKMQPIFALVEIGKLSAKLEEGTTNPRHRRTQSRSRHQRRAAIR